MCTSVHGPPLSMFPCSDSTVYVPVIESRTLIGYRAWHWSLYPACDWTMKKSYVVCVFGPDSGDWWWLNMGHGLKCLSHRGPDFWLCRSGLDERASDNQDAYVLAVSVSSLMHWESKDYPCILFKSSILGLASDGGCMRIAGALHIWAEDVWEAQIQGTIPLRRVGGCQLLHRHTPKADIMQSLAVSLLCILWGRRDQGRARGLIPLSHTVYTHYPHPSCIPSALTTSILFFFFIIFYLPVSFCIPFFCTSLYLP